MENLIPLFVLIASLLAGVPIVFALIVAGSLGIWITTGQLSSLEGVLRTIPFATSSEYVLVTIPLFVFMGFLIARAGMAEKLFDAAASWFYRLPGGLAVSTLVASMVFGAMCGASTAAAAVLAGIALPHMRRAGMADSLAAGTISVGATVAVLIPPSLGMIIYGIATETSIGKLLIAGVLPGVLLTVMTSVAVVIWAKLLPHMAGKSVPVARHDRWASLIAVWPALLLIIGLIVALYTGFATATELAAVGVVGACLIGVALRHLTLAGFLSAAADSVRTSAMIFAIIIGAGVFSTYMALSQIPQSIVEAIGAAGLNRWVVIAAICVGYFVISMVMDENPLLLLTLPITFPVVVSLGFDPVWFGVVSMLLVAAGLVFPPVGLVAFIVSSAGGVGIGQVYLGTSVLVVPILLTLVLIMIFPEIALWLPSLMQR